MPLPLPPCVEDEEGSRRFITRFVRALPTVVSAIAMCHSSQSQPTQPLPLGWHGEALMTYAKVGLQFMTTFHELYEMGVPDPQIKECATLLSREKYDAIVDAAERLCSSTLARTQGEQGSGSATVVGFEALSLTVDGTANMDQNSTGIVARKSADGGFFGWRLPATWAAMLSIIASGVAAILLGAGGSLSEGVVVVALVLSCIASISGLLSTRSLYRNAMIARSSRMVLEDMIEEILSMTMHHAHSHQPAHGGSNHHHPSNPLAGHPPSDVEGGDGLGGAGAGGASSFLIEPEEAFLRKGQIDALLMEADDDDGKILVRTKGFSRAAVTLAALNPHLLFVVTDMEGRVTFWNDGAARLCGFSARDVEGKHISSFLFGEKSQSMYERMTDAAVNGIEAAGKVLSLANLTHGSVSLYASVVVARSGEDERTTVGFVLMASSQESDSQRGVSQFHQYLVTDLLNSDCLSASSTATAGSAATAGVLVPASPVSLEDWRSVRFSLEQLNWKNLEDLAMASRDWNPVLIQAVLSDVVKDRHRQCDVRVLPSTPEVVICDQSAVTRALVQGLQLFEGKVRVQISHRRLTDSVHQLVAQLQKTGLTGSRNQSGAQALQKLAFPEESTEMLRRSIAEVGAQLVVSHEGNFVKLCLPFVAEGGGGGADSLLRARTSSENRVASSVPPMTILLLEKNAVYRHNISTIAWASGHSLRVMDSVAKAIKSVNDANADLGCAIIDADLRDADKLVETLARYRIFTIQTSESGDSSAKSSPSFLLKPTTRALLEKELERAAQSIKERKRVDEEVLRQREIFGKVRNSPWTRGRKLGRGAFADVYEAVSTMTGGKMAVKMIRLVGGFKERVKDLINEIEILCSLTHPHIVHYFYCERAETTINLFMELADEGSLADRLAVQTKLTEDQLAIVIKQLLLAVNYLHDQNIIHRDIKPGNMLISKGVVKLSDFGTATNSVISEGTQGTIFYMAPEVVDGASYGKECDIWSIGCVMCECLGIRRPARLNGLLGYGMPTAFPPEVSAACVDFITLCLQEEASERPTAGSLLLHDFIVSARLGSSGQARLPEMEWRGGPSATAGGGGAGAGPTGAEKHSVGNLSVNSSKESSVASW